MGGLIKSALQYTSSSNISTSANGFLASLHNGAGSSTSNGIVCLSPLTQGTGYANRTGNQVKFMRLTVRGFTYMATPDTAETTDGIAPVLGRIIFFVVRSNVGSALATGPSDPSTWLQDWNSNTFSVALANYNPDTVPSRIRVLKEIVINPINVNQVVTGTGLSLSTVGARQVYWKFSKSISRFLRGAYSTYNGSGSGTTACEQNHIFAAFLQSNTSAAAPSFETFWTFKLSFLP